MTMIRVKATRTFNGHTAGDVLLVEQTSEIEQLVKSKLFEVLAVESTPPETTPGIPPDSLPAKAKKPAAKKAKKGKA